MKNKPMYIKGLNLLVLMFVVYGTIHILFNPPIVHHRGAGADIASYNYLKNIIVSLLPIYSFYYLALQGYLTENKLKIWFAVFILSCTLSYFVEMRETMMELGKEEITNNAGYIMLSLLPGLALFRKKILIQFILLGYVMAFGFLSMKRGVILIGAATIPILIWEEFKTATRKQKRWIVALCLLLVIIGVNFISYQMDTSDFLMRRIADTQEGQASGRDDLYSFFLNYFLYENSILTFIVGNGAYATLDLYFNFAHNDWLEIAINQGLIGIVIYMIYWLFLYRTIVKAKNATARIGLAIFGIICFIKTFISMSYEDLTYISTSVVGLYLATYDKYDILEKSSIKTIRRYEKN